MIHDPNLVEALEALPVEQWEGEVFRVLPAGRDPLAGSYSAGRWSIKDAFGVLYTSLTAEGAIAEVAFTLARQPIWPSKPYLCFRLGVSTEKTIVIASEDALRSVGIDPTTFDSLKYQQCQAVAAAANFLGRDGLLVPSARHSSKNLVLLLENHDPRQTLNALDSSPVDWAPWRPPES